MLSKLLVPLDRSPLAEEAVATAAMLARAAHARLEVVLVHTPTPHDGVLGAEWNALERPSELAYVGGIADEVTRGAGVEVETRVVSGAPADEICRRAQLDGVDLIVMTSHGRTGLSRLWMGSVADAVVRHAPVPVLVLHPAGGDSPRRRTPAPIRRVLVPLDESTASEAILAPVAEIARATGASILLLHVVVPPPLVEADYSIGSVRPLYLPDLPSAEELAAGARERLEALRQRVAQASGRPVETRVVIADSVVPTIIETARAEEAGLIAMTTHGRGASRLLLGSIADKLLRAMELPTLVVRPATGAERMEEGAVAASAAL